MSVPEYTSQKKPGKHPAHMPERVLVLSLRDCEIVPTDSPEQQYQRERRWKEALTAVRQAVPGTAQLRQGWCAMRARGPSRYYGGEREAAEAVHACLAGTLGADCAASAMIGIASSRFAAEQAAIEQATARPGIGRDTAYIVAAELTADFLTPLPISRVADESLAEVLVGLGLRTLGAFAALPEEVVLQRFGRDALIAHRRSRGLGEFRSDEVSAIAPARELTVFFEFEPPLDGVDQLAFASGVHAERFTSALGGQGLVCTELRIELRDDRGGSHLRCWSHPANFTAYDVLNRIRWQAASLAQEPDSAGAGIVSVRLSPQRTADAAAHEPGLWNDAPDERVHHQLTRVQSLIGHEGAGTGVLIGGRLSSDRQVFVPWGTSSPTQVSSRPSSGRSPSLPSGKADEPPHGPGPRDGPRPRGGPWPGSLTEALPNTVFEVPPRVDLLGVDGEPILVDADELLNERPAAFRINSTGEAQDVRGWTAPWPLREKWWTHRTPARYRMQIVLADGEAWLLQYEPGTGWYGEGRYA